MSYKSIFKTGLGVGLILFMVLASASGYAGEKSSNVVVKIAPDIPSVVVSHRGIPIEVKRIQDTSNKLVDDFAKTSRPCPPFCIHPIQAAKGVKTIGEIELLDFVSTEVANKTGLLIDARMPKWYNSETIPGAINLPFIIFSKKGKSLNRIFELLGARKTDHGYDFSHAKKLALFCNGPWCDQSPRAIRALIADGYPPEKLRYYRGGMQMWKLFGLTTVLPQTNMVSKK